MRTQKLHGIWDTSTSITAHGINNEARQEEEPPILYLNKYSMSKTEKLILNEIVLLYKQDKCYYKHLIQKLIEKTKLDRKTILSFFTKSRKSNAFSKEIEKAFN
jgi:hypothetical protein